MKDRNKRLIKEHKELLDKIYEVYDELGELSPTSKRRSLLYIQLAAMETYQIVLEERIG